MSRLVGLLSSNAADTPDGDCLQITLASVLARSDQECLLSELKTLVTETQVTVSSKAEVQAVCEQLQRVSCCSLSRRALASFGS